MSRVIHTADCSYLVSVGHVPCKKIIIEAIDIKNELVYQCVGEDRNFDIISFDNNIEIGKLPDGNLQIVITDKSRKYIGTYLCGHIKSDNVTNRMIRSVAMGIDTKTTTIRNESMLLLGDIWATVVAFGIGIVVLILFQSIVLTYKLRSL